MCRNVSDQKFKAQGEGIYLSRRKFEVSIYSTLKMVSKIDSYINFSFPFLKMLKI